MERINEIWNPIKGFEGLYEVSSFGNVMSLPRKGKGGRTYSKILSGGICSGYFALTLCDKGKYKRLKKGDLGSDIAKSYNVNKVTIYGIKKGKTWKHLLA